MLGIHDYFSYFIFEDEVTRTISIPTGSTSRNIMVEVPISELAADARSAIVTASYGTTSYRLETYTQDLGNSLKVFTVVMEDVPGNVNSITVKVESRTGTGDSFIVGGVNLRIQCGGNAPEALPDAAATTVNTAVAIDILANDIDLDNNLDIASLTNLGVLDPQNGSLSSFDATTGSVTYTPDAAFTGIDVFEYLLCDSTGICDIGQVTVTVTCAGGQFVNATNFYNLNLGGAKDGGLTWADFNNDGNIDVLVNTTNTTNDSRLYFADAAGLLTFTDVTTTNASGLLDNNCRRTAIAADLNNDGYVDFLRNYFDRIEIYYNKGPNSNPAYSFGTGTQDPNIVITAITGGMNTEGIGFIDWNSDGYLDIVVDNDNNGTEIYENDKDGTFTLQTPGTGAGQPDFPASIGDNGDYMALADYNNDGHTDLIIRKDATDANGVDIWEYNPATSRYDGIASPNIAADGGNKGAITFCDLDNDADLDMIWTAGPGTANKIYENSGGTYTLQSTLLADAGIDECDCADVDNDGDLDIFFGDDAGTSYLYKNNGAFSFTQDNDCINPAADVEGSEFVDFDGDGDMDLYMNINGAANQLWVNSQNDQNFLKVEARESVGNGLYRAALGANIVLSECGGTDSLVQEVSGGRGHGSQKPSTVHFGLGSNGDSKAFNVVVYFPEVDGSIDTVIRTLVPNLYANQTISITRGDADNENCTDTDGDGVPDISDTDVDGDGVLNSAEYSEFTSPFADSDNDGVYDYLDSDFSACGGIVNGVCSAFDQDGDGLADFFDLDSDNDGTSDVLEAGGTDSNSDGIIDNNNSDTDGDGYPNSVDSDNGGTALADPDSDRDGVKNRVDLDSDNDGIMDIIEVGLTDSNGDGVSDVLTDTDGDGLANPYDSDNGGTAPTLPDTDSDGFKNYVDSDSDNDGIPDVIEAQTTAAYTAPAEADADGDGIDDSFDGGSGLVPVDTDSDGTPDYLDTDSDNDGVSDNIEAYDLNYDDVVDNVASGTDSDGDGLDNTYDSDAASTTNAGGSSNNSQTAASFPDTYPTTAERSWREERLPIKTGPGDVEVTSSCPVFSGSDWIDVTGGSGNIVYSINPNGNNLGATCWGLRMLSGSASVRKDTNNAFPEYILNRNFYLEPTTQPTSNVDIKFYVLKTEVADLRTALATDGYGNGASEQAFVDDSLKITESKPATINLDPLDNAGASANQLNPENTSFTADGYALSVRAGELGEFIPGMVPNLPNAALPIQLLDFWLEKGERKLWAKWRVASEKNVLNYEIERSTDLNSWKSVGTVDAQGQNNGQMEYSLLDEQVLFGTSYYRLMSHEFDGRTVIEGIRSVDFEQSGKLAVIYPNPTRSSIFIDLNQIKGNTAVQIFNVAGALVYDSEISGSELHAIELNLPAGSYHVELTHPGGRQSERLIITN